MRLTNNCGRLISIVATKQRYPIQSQQIRRTEQLVGTYNIEFSRKQYAIYIFPIKALKTFNFKRSFNCFWLGILKHIEVMLSMNRCIKIALRRLHASVRANRSIIVMKLQKTFLFKSVFTTVGVAAKIGSLFMQQSADFVLF